MESQIAPHAIVMNANGNSFPANTGPSPSDATRERRHPERRENHQDRDREHQEVVIFRTSTGNRADIGSIPHRQDRAMNP